MTRFLFVVLLSLIIACSNSVKPNGDESDSNNTLDTATPLVLGSPIKMNLSEGLDVDCYSFTVPGKGGVIHVEASDVPLNLHLFATIFDGNKKELSGGLQDGTVLDYMIILKPGKYYAQLQSTGSGTYSSASFDMKVWLDTLDSQEWNNDTSSAFPTTLNHTYRGSLQTENDIDYFKIVIDADNIYRVVIDSIPSILPQDFNSTSWEIYDEGGKKLSTGVLNHGQNVLGFILKKGTYYFDVGTILNVSNSPYYLIAVVDTLDPSEFNNDTTVAKTIHFGDRIIAAIYPDKDLDFFKITLPFSDSVFVSVDSISPSLSFSVDIYDTTLSNLTNWYSTPSNGSVRFKKYLQSGTYFIKATDGWGSSSLKRYYLGVDTVNLQ